MTVEALTDDTEIIEVKKNNISEVELSKKLNVSENILYTWNRWVEIDDKWYYFKNLDTQSYLMNELIGEKLADKMGLETVHYKLAKEKRVYPIMSENIGNIDYSYGIISENFRKQENTYIDSNMLKNISNKTNLSALNGLRNYCKNYNNYAELIKKFIKLIVLDFYMQQTDRRGTNLCFSKDKDDYFDLCPAFDYELSFTVSRNYYFNTLIGIYLENKQSLNEIQNNSLFQKEFNRIMDIDINEIITEVLDNYKLNIRSKYLEVYKDHDDRFKEIVKQYKIIK